MGKGKQKIVEANDNKLNFTPSMIREPTFHPFMPSEKIDGEGVRDRLGRKFAIEGFVTSSEADSHTKDSGKRGSRTNSEHTLSDISGEEDKKESSEIQRAKKKR